MQYSVINYGENALLMQFKDVISLEVHQYVKSCYEQLTKLHLIGVQSLIPAYNSITILFDPLKINQKDLRIFIENTPFDKYENQQIEKNIVEIPVCYQEPYALDLAFVASELGVTKQNIIDIHSAKPYLVYMLGFAPGFMYLGGLDERLQIARKQTPRIQIPAGAVGLADKQTGVYPLVTPGGWQIIGQTPLPLFSKEKPSLVQMGDYVQFVPISVNEFEKMKKQ
ncbi:5-oxoprolinase subunit PxpB [Wenyingzhuangia sp. IMCC45467]